MPHTSSLLTAAPVAGAGAGAETLFAGAGFISASFVPDTDTGALALANPAYEKRLPCFLGPACARNARCMLTQ